MQHLNADKLSLRRVIQTIHNWLHKRFNWLHSFEKNLASTKSPEWFTVISTALLVGIGAGFGAVIFRALIVTAQIIFLDGGAKLFGFMGDFYFFFIPALGGIAVGLLIHFFAREAKGYGVPEVMEAVALKGGRIRPHVVIAKGLTASICIGSGGSVGREGPIVQIGAALGSTVGQIFRLPPERMRSLVACGAAGSIAATFNAPIAGSIFALEVILGEIEASYFGAVVISAVMADVVAYTFTGSVRAFPIPAYELVSMWELVLYAGLGVLAGLTGLIYARLIYRMQDVFERGQKLPEYAQPALGGLFLGLIGIVCVQTNLTYTRGDNEVPGVFGVGYELIEPALLADLAVGTALGLLALKLIATALTIGSGGSGGVSAPLLFIGAMLGMSFGSGVHLLFPDHTAPAGAYALVGMAATYAGAIHAPATAIIILFEMTGDYNIILPLMFATVLSMIISRAIAPESIYTLKLSRRGVKLQRKRDVDILETVLIAESMSEVVDSVPASMPLAQLVNEFDRTHHHGFTVLDDDGKLFGVVTLHDLEQALLTESLEGHTVADITTTTGLAVGHPDETMAAALWRMGVHKIGRLPIVDRWEVGQLLGVVRRADIIEAYEQALSRRTEVSYRLKELHEAYEGHVRVVKVEITDTHDLADKTVRDIAQKMPADCILVGIRRGNQFVIPHGDTVLENGDHVTILASSSCAQHVHELLNVPPD